MYIKLKGYVDIVIKSLRTILKQKFKKITLYLCYMILLNKLHIISYPQNLDCENSDNIFRRTGKKVLLSSGEK